jgi:hypothetical protein
VRAPCSFHETARAEIDEAADHHDAEHHGLGPLFADAQERSMAADPVEPGRWTRAWVRTSVSAKGPSDHDATAAGLLAAIATNPALADPMRDRYTQWRARAAADGIPAEVAAIVTLAADGMWMADLLGLSAPAGDERRRIIERLLEMASGDR